MSSVSAPVNEPAKKEPAVTAPLKESAKKEVASTQAPAKEPAKEPIAPPTDASSRKTRAGQAIHRNVLWALGGGVLPLPLLDVAAVTAVELKLLKELADIYQVEFSPGIAKKIVYSLLANIGLVGVGTVIGISFIKFVPFLGMSLGFISVSALVGAFTDSLGQTVLLHLEAGGTLQDFSPTAMGAYFRNRFKRAKTEVKEMRVSGESKKSENQA
jgi:uncharacterized protein (DUF697 family)